MQPEQLRKLEEQDLLVIDSARTGLVSDPLSVAAHASATLLVVGTSKTNAAQAATVIRTLRDVGANVTRAHVNKAPHRSLARRYYRYGYSRYPYGARIRTGSDASSQASPSEDDRKPLVSPKRQRAAAAKWKSDIAQISPVGSRADEHRKHTDAVEERTHACTGTGVDKPRLRGAASEAAAHGRCRDQGADAVVTAMRNTTYRAG